jgi:signal recognition particle receptor subunit beta
MRKTIAKPIEGITINGLRISIYEIKKEYEIHVIFKNKSDINDNEKLDNAIEYLSKEGYFDKNKNIKVIGMKFNKKGNMDNGSFFSSDE